MAYWHWSNASLLPYFLLFVSGGQLMLAGLQVSYLVFGVHGLLLWRLERRRREGGRRFDAAAWYRAGWVLTLAIFAYTVALTDFVDVWAGLQFAIVSLALVANWATTRTWTWSWVAWMVVNVLQAIYFAHAGLWAQFGLQFVLFAMSAHGLRDVAATRSRPRSPSRSAAADIEVSSPCPALSTPSSSASSPRCTAGHQVLLDHAVSDRRAAHRSSCGRTPTSPRCPTRCVPAGCASSTPTATVRRRRRRPGERCPRRRAARLRAPAARASRPRARRGVHQRGVRPGVRRQSRRRARGVRRWAHGAEVSGTAIRADVHRHRGELDPRVYRHFVERVVFLGAESTGKSTLTGADGRGADARSPSPSTGVSTTNVVAAG